jgi:chromosome segregation ATPase
VDRESREGRSPDDGDTADEFKLAWREADDRWTEAAEDKSTFSPKSGKRQPTSEPDAGGVPWDELADDSPAQFEEATFRADPPTLVPDTEEDQAGSHPDDEAPPHGDPLERQADEVFERDRPSARMNSLQDALAAIRERVQSLSTTVQEPGQRGAASSQLALYRAATDDRAYSELRRHSHDTENLLRRLSQLMQDLSLDLRSIVDAARRAIDQTSEQAESSIDMGRLLGERIEQMDAQIAARLDSFAHSTPNQSAVVDRVEQIVRALDTLHGNLDKRLTKIEQRSGVGVVREEVGGLRSDVGDVRGELGTLRSDVGDVRAELSTLRGEVGAAGQPDNADLQQRLDVVSGQLDRTLTILREVVEGAPEQDVDMVDGVAAAIRSETEAAVEPFRVEVEELGRQLSAALEREAQLGDTLTTLTDEVQRLRKRIAVRAAPPSINDEQIETIVAGVVAALPGRRPPSRSSRPPIEVEPEPELDVDFEPEPEPEPKPEPARKRRRATRAKKAEPEPEYELDINEPFAPGELDIDDSHLDVDPDEEPIRRARGTGRKAARPVTKGRRTRSSKR